MYTCFALCWPCSHMHLFKWLFSLSLLSSMVSLSSSTTVTHSLVTADKCADWYSLTDAYICAYKNRYLPRANANISAKYMYFFLMHIKCMLYICMHNVQCTIHMHTHFVDMGGSSGEVHDLCLSTVPSTHHTGSVILLDWHARLTCKLSWESQKWPGCNE